MKMKLKKILALMLALLLALGCLAGCQGSSETSKESQTESGTVSEESPEAVTSDAGTENDESSEVSEESSETVEESGEAAESSEVSEAEEQSQESEAEEVTYAPIEWTVSVGGQTVSSFVDTLSFVARDENGRTSDKLEEEQLSRIQKDLLEKAILFPYLTLVDLGKTEMTLEEIRELSDALNGCTIACTFKEFGYTIDTLSEKLDFSETLFKVEDTKRFDDILPVMPNLTKVVMCDCGLDNEQMDALDKAHEDVQFVWMLHFQSYKLRTDATYFCASDRPEHGYSAQNLYDEDLEQFKYLNDMVCLDLGHMYYMYDLSFLEYMPELEYLLIVECGATDLSPIASCKKLNYLEIFCTKFEDFTPLLGCPVLEHINIGYSDLPDLAPLHEMKQLKRLWIPGNSLSQEEKEALKADLPDTVCYLPSYDPEGSTGGGWRTDPSYYTMRDLLHMFYSPGGTGMH